MEYIDIVDENNNPTGEKAEKNEVHIKPLWYREIVCFILHENQVLIQKRALTKKEKPGMWEICFGHVSSGETPKQAVIREVEEETGIYIEPNELEYIGTYKTKEVIKDRFHYVFSYVYVFKTDKKIEEIVMQKEEVSDVKYITFSVLEEKVKKKDKELAFSEFPYILEAMEYIKEKVIGKGEDKMKQLLHTNCFDTNETMLIMGTCLKQMQPEAYKELEKLTPNIYEVCLEETHLNMVTTKIAGMIAREKIKHLYFATVDKSPHCLQLHYVIKELENMMDLSKITIKNYVAVENELIEIPLEVISLSKNLSKLKEKFSKE